MERIKLGLCAAFLMCCTIFMSTFFYLKPVEVDDVYTHMQSQFQEVFDAIALPQDTIIIEKEEFLLPLSSEIIKERVTSLFTNLQVDSLYEYSEDTVLEITANIESIYEKERQRLNQEDGKEMILWIQVASGSGCILVAACFLVLMKKRKLVKKSEHIS